MKRSGMRRAIDLLMALTAFALGCIVAAHYPLGALVALPVFAALSLMAFLTPRTLLIVIPALLPILGFSPWTGWITFEELDLLVLATSAGGYARCALSRTNDQRSPTSTLLVFVGAMMSASLLISMIRGFVDAGGFTFGWYQGYDGPMNSLRVGKSFFLALMLTPLISRLHKKNAPATTHDLGTGFALGLGITSLAALLERLAFTDLLNFSSDYRTTAYFWEMHVGGAALDGWLLLTVPFAVWLLRNSRSTLQFALSLVLIVATAYACLTTFSRGVYLALLVSLPLLGWLISREHRHSTNAEVKQRWGIWQWSLATILLCAIAVLGFRHGGYRGLAALLGTIAISLSIPSILRGLSLKSFAVACTAGLGIGAMLATQTDLVPKGAYVLYALALATALLFLYLARNRATRMSPVFLVATYFSLVPITANLAGHWGGPPALLGAISAMCILFGVLLWGSFSRIPLWPDDIRWQGTLLTLATGVSSIVAVFIGGAYMDTRFSTSGQDLEARLSHWQQTAAMLRTPMDWTFGKGLGRFPANYFFAIPDSAFPGTYRINNDGNNSSLHLVAPRHPISFGDIFRVSQRLPLDSLGPYAVDLKVKTKSNVVIHAEVCEKHLLYPGTCVVGNTTIKTTNGDWQPAHIQLNGPLLLSAPWYAPRLKMFSVGIGNESGAADIDDLRLTTHEGPDLLKNGSFEEQMRYWFFSSDRDHMPWHAKNLLINIMFDQGTFGMLAFVLLTVTALWRLNLGRGKHHELAPYLTAAMIGFLVVGTFDSLTDVPRLAFAYYLLLLFALQLRGSNPDPRKAAGRFDSPPFA